MKHLVLFENSKARLLFTNDCNRNCKGCCNKNWTERYEVKCFYKR